MFIIKEVRGNYIVFYKARILQDAYHMVFVGSWCSVLCRFAGPTYTLVQLQNGTLPLGLRWLKKFQPGLITHFC